MSYRLTILGCGPSGGVPRLGPHWGKCDPLNPKNRRRRCAVLVQRFSKKGCTTVLIDTPPDLREQLIDARICELDAVLYTHDHADHTHGIDDLRPVCFATGRRINVFADQETISSLKKRFSYCFETDRESGYAPILRAHVARPGKPIRIEGAGGVISLMPILQEHGRLTSLGYRVGALGYSPDVSGFPEGSVALLEGIDVWVVDALRTTPHPSHFHVKKSLSWIEKLAPKRAVLTHMTTELDYETLTRDLPEGVEPAYDGMVIDF